MVSIEQTARPQAGRCEQALAAQRRLGWGARWMSSFRGEISTDKGLKPEDVARSEVFYSSTGCWV